MERSELINRVKVRIDEICASGDVIVEVDVENSKPFDSIIDEVLDESALELLLKAPFYRLHISTANLTASANEGDSKIGSISLPNDFVRLVSLQMKEWHRPVTTLAIQGDPVAKRQSNKYLRGGVARPIAVLRKTANGYELDYYSVKESHDIKEFLYIKRDSAEDVANTELLDALCWICAGKVLGVIGQANLAKMCYENAQGLMV